MNLQCMAKNSVTEWRHLLVKSARKSGLETWIVLGMRFASSLCPDRLEIEEGLF